MKHGESIYNQDDATGFIKLNALRLRVKAMVEKQVRKKL
jgi:argininosuccinate synthase